MVLLLPVIAALPAQENAAEGGGEQRYYDSGLGNDDFSRSLRATMRGEDFRKAKQHEAALEAFNEAIALMPDRMYAAWIGRGDLYYYVYKEYDKALADYTEVIRRVPEDYVPYRYEFIRRSAPGQVFFAYYGRANVYGARGEHEKAITDYTAAIKLWPEHSSPYMFRAVSYAALGEDDKAVADYTQVITTANSRNIDPLNFTAAYIERAELYRKQRRYEEALADYDEAISRGGANLSIAYNNRGIIYRIKGEPDRAIEDYTEALRLNAGFAEAYNTRGNAWIDKGEQDRAIEDYNQALRINPGYAQAYNNRGYACYEKGDMDKARADWEHTLRLNPDHAQARQNLERLRQEERAAASDPES
ncbi:MAG: tetratricopeptide repeat protein [Treponema sp.]|jgi:tetratricopeptide (TPR) repeat protein|nr:tetratricopeptide repeat protein [Treponema sp.]